LLSFCNKSAHANTAAEAVAKQQLLQAIGCASDFPSYCWAVEWQVQIHFFLRFFLRRFFFLRFTSPSILLSMLNY
jgi:hypothetical protein